MIISNYDNNKQIISKQSDDSYNYNLITIVMIIRS